MLDTIRKVKGSPNAMLPESETLSYARKMTSNDGFEHPPSMVSYIGTSKPVQPQPQEIALGAC